MDNKCQYYGVSISAINALIKRVRKCFNIQIMPATFPDLGISARCLNGTDAKRKHLAVPIGTEGINLSKQMVEKIDTEPGRRTYPQRLAIVDPVFANIRSNKRLDRLRGKVKVNIQWLMYCLVHYIEKVLNYGLAPV